MQLGQIWIHKGLEEIYVKKTKISFIDGKNGKLYYRGYRIEDLVKYSNYEEVAYLLIFGELPTRRKYEKWINDLSRERKLSYGMKIFLQKIPKWNAPIDVLKSGIVYLGLWDRAASNINMGALYYKIIRILAKAPSIVAAWHRIRQNSEIIDPCPDFNTAQNFLYMLTGEEPDLEIADMFDKILILHAEHGMNASAFSGMVTISTLSDIYSAIISALNTLKGLLHGGATEAILKMFKEIGSPDKVKEYVEKKLARKERILGFGHRVYKTYDPRAKILKEIIGKLTIANEQKALYEIALKVEEVCMNPLCRTRGICPNIDFFSGIACIALGLSEDFAPAIFAVSRLAGWIAHIVEYLQENRLIRPRAYYVGELDKEYTPLNSRQ